MSIPHTKQAKSSGKTSRPDRHATGPIKANGGGTSEQQEKVMRTQTDPALKLQSRIARRSERIARWNKEYNEVEASWCGGLEYQKVLPTDGGEPHEKQQELVAELEQLRNHSPATPGLEGNSNQGSPTTSGNDDQTVEDHDLRGRTDRQH